MFARKSLLISVSQITSALLGYIGLFFIARFMGPETVGVLGFGISFVGLFSFIANLGFLGAHIKRVSEGKDLGKCIGTYLTIKVVLLLITALSVICSIAVWKFVLGMGFEHSVQETVVYIILLQTILAGFYDVMSNTFTARMEIAKDQISWVVDSVTRVPVVICFVTLGLDIVAIAFAYFFGVLCRLLAALYFFKEYPINRFDKDYFRSYLSYAAPLALLSVVGTIALYFDKTMIQLFWGAVDVGYYFGVQRLLAVMVFITTPITVMIFPTISKLHANNQIESIKKLMHTTERYLLMVVFPLAAIAIALSRPIIHIFLSDDFLPAVSILQLLVIWETISVLNIPYKNLIPGIGKVKALAKIGILAVILNIVLNLIFIPTSIYGIKFFGLGALGAALASLISIVVTFIAYSVVAFRLTGAKPSICIIKHLGSAIIVGVSLYQASKFLFIDTWYQFFGVCAIGIAIYVGILYALREFTKEDFHFFLDTLNLRKMVDYVKSELRRHKR